MSSDKRAVAFRDAVLEAIVQRLFERLLERIATGGLHPVRDGMTVKDTEFQQKDKMFEVKGNVNHVKVSGYMARLSGITNPADQV
jgi:hypothetical protein